MKVFHGRGAIKIIIIDAFTIKLSTQQPTQFISVAW